MENGTHTHTELVNRYGWLEHTQLLVLYLEIEDKKEGRNWQLSHLVTAGFDQEKRVKKSRENGDEWRIDACVCGATRFSAF